MTVNLERRKVVMARSRKLGHCICNPQEGCPCEIFEQHNVCPCAGERMPFRSEAVALTQHVRKAGCASKIGQADLHRILSVLPPVTDPNVLLGAAAGDDAGVYRIDDRWALVQTVDVFTPCVDDARLFGQIAAANSVSDVYAMGARPLTALSIVGFPIDELDGRFMQEMLQGGIEKLQEAGCSLIGGHSINDQEIKCGFAVTGLIEAGAAVERDRARPGDALVLTKPLGTGMVAFGAQIGRISADCLAEVGAAMAELNKDAAELMVERGAHACTDVTGFGLAGHLVEMMRGSGARAEIDLSALPVFSAVDECLEQEILGGAIERNREYSMAWVEAAEPAAERDLPILYDPQTSGGLLIALPPEAAAGFVQAMHDRGHPSAAVIGRVVEAGDGEHASRVVVSNPRPRSSKASGAVLPRPEPPVPRKAAPSPAAAAHSAEAACCDSPPVFGPEAGLEPEDGQRAGDLFVTFMKKANQPGAIDARAKKLMAVALSIALRCETCLGNHIEGALAMGISRAEIDEAADLAVEFGGCPALMFYREACRELGI